MLLRNLSKFIQLRSILKSRFNKINTNSNITPPNNLDMATFKFLFAWDFWFNKINTNLDITPPNNLDMATFKFLFA
jgi:hypothetical protein